MRMGQSVESYIANGGWSSKEFLTHAKFVFAELPRHDVRIVVGRTTVHLHRTTRNGCEVLALKCYVHFQGNSREYLTITDAGGNALRNFYCDCKPEDILDFILTTIDQQRQGDPVDYSRFDLFQVAENI